MTADLVRDTRGRLKLTPTQFGKLMGVSRQTIWRWENDKREPSETAHILLGLWRYLYRVEPKNMIIFRKRQVRD